MIYDGGIQCCCGAGKLDHLETGNVLTTSDGRAVAPALGGCPETGCMEWRPIIGDMPVIKPWMDDPDGLRA